MAKVRTISGIISQRGAGENPGGLFAADAWQANRLLHHDNAVVSEGMVGQAIRLPMCLTGSTICLTLLEKWESPIP